MTDRLHTSGAGSVDILDQADFAFLQASARAAKALNIPHFTHLDQPIGIWNYIRIAHDIWEQMPVGYGQILDWGCGYGQMSYLLQRRGYTVIPFDVGDPMDPLPDIPLCHALSFVRVLEPTRLPFEDASFDAVLSCGVLEHVDEYSQPGNEIKSLGEIARVLRPGSLFFIYQLPQQYAWQEFAIRHLKLGYAHPRRFRVNEIIGMLGRAGFRVQRLRCANLIPRNLTGMPERLRVLYSRLSRPLIALDKQLCRVPPLNQIAGVLEITARKV